MLPDDAHAARRSAIQIDQHDRAVHGGAPVAILRWPEQRALAEQLCHERLPRLIVLESPTAPVIADDPLQDWVRLPVSVRDLRARLHSLRSAAPRRHPRPVLDGDGRLLHDGLWVGLSAIEERLAGALVAHFEQTVTNSELVSQAWPDRATAIGTLRTRIQRLRHRLDGLNLDITAIRNVGYILHARTTDTASPTAAEQALPPESTARTVQVQPSRPHRAAELGDRSVCLDQAEGR